MSGPFSLPLTRPSWLIRFALVRRATVFCLDRFEAACVGWPVAIAENDMRLLLPCDERLYETSQCHEGDNPVFWPPGIETEEERGPRIGTFAWLCRVVCLGGRIQEESYRAAGEFRQFGTACECENGGADLGASVCVQDERRMDLGVTTTFNLRITSIMFSPWTRTWRSFVGD